MIRGTEQLVEMRLSGKRPATLTLFIGDCDAGMASSWAEYDPGKGYLHALPDEPLSGADLRCVVGLPVFVVADPGEWDAARAYGRLCAESGAARVVALATDAAGQLWIADTERGEL